MLLPFQSHPALCLFLHLYFTPLCEVSQQGRLVSCFTHGKSPLSRLHQFETCPQTGVRAEGLFKSFLSMTEVFLPVPPGGRGVCGFVMTGPSQEEL